MNICGSRRCAKPLGRYLQCPDSAVQKGKHFEKNVKLENSLEKATFSKIMSNFAENKRLKTRMSHLYNFEKNKGCTFAPCFILKNLTKWTN
jgi:hypothetical protein